MEPGRVLSARYELSERLGSGGMAEVFHATDRVLGRDVAVKVLLPHLAGDEDFVRRFRREARSAASLNHPNVVAVHDTGSDEGTHFIVMELVEGPTLETVIAERGPLPIDEVVDVTRDACRALEAAHAAGLVHRDVKPGNIMFDASGVVKVTDFGIALATASTRLTQRSDVYGSAPYLAPEQARGGDVDQRADVYALGCVAYAMLTGEPPFTGPEPIAVVYQHLHGELEPPSARREGIPAGLDAVVLRMLAREPEDRYGSARQVHEDLDRVAVGDAPEAAAGIVATRRLPADETVPVAPDETVPMAHAGAGPTPGPPRAGDDGAPPDRDGRAVSRTGLAAVAAVVLLAALLAATLLGPEPAADPGPTATTPATDTASSAPPSPPPPATVEDAVFGLFDVIDTGRQQGGISRKAAEELRKVGEETLEKFQQGEIEEAFEKLDEGRRKLEELTREGEVEQDQAAAVLAAMDEIEQALGREEPPPESDGDGNGEGRGNGNGDGNGDGKGRGQGDD